MKHKFVLLLAILGFGTLVCVLLFSRDNKLQYQQHQQVPATADASPAQGLTPNLEPLADAPAPAVEAVPAAAKSDAATQPPPKTVAAKAKS
ncbi:MAG TPA: hypothetical protein VFF76_00610 [Holophagaceae bacterium]|jgi:hypothetical protein|nr:hypothetical protein [Holophagaceae bacterium]